MQIKGEYRLTYSEDDILNELIVEVELKPITGLIKPFQNVYHGIVYVNGLYYNKKDLSYCVNAICAAEEIGLELKDELKKRLRKEGKSFRLKKEELK
jgi:hypothetical protein